MLEGRVLKACKKKMSFHDKGREVRVQEVIERK